MSPKLPIRMRFLPTFLIDVHLKLTQFHPGLGQGLLKLILSHEQKRAKVASIGRELCMHRLVCHGDPDVEWTGAVRRQFQMDSLSHARR